MQTVLNLHEKHTKPPKSLNIRKSSMNQDNWTPSSWKNKPVLQQAEYPDKQAFAEELAKVRKVP